MPVSSFRNVAPIRRDVDPNFAGVPEETDPLEALRVFIEGNAGGPSNPAPLRNNATVGVLRKQLGMGPDPLDALPPSNPADPLTQRSSHSAFVGSQSELEEAERAQYDQTMTREHTKHQHALEDFFMPGAQGQRDEVQAEKMEPINAQGQTARDVATINSEGDIAQQRIASEGLIDAANAKASSTAAKTLPSGLMERVAGANSALKSIERLDQLRGNGGTAVTGPVMGRMNSFMQGVPGLSGDQGFNDQSAELAILANSMIKAITGAQMSEQEAERLMRQIMTVNDRDDVYVSKRNALDRSTRDMLNEVQNAQEGHYNPGTGLTADQLMRIAQRIGLNVNGGHAAGGEGDDLGADWGR